MDQEGFRELLKTRKLNNDQIEASIAIAERYEQYRFTSGDIDGGLSAWKFSKLLIQEGKIHMKISSLWSVMDSL